MDNIIFFASRNTEIIYGKFLKVICGAILIGRRVHQIVFIKKHNIKDIARSEGGIAFYLCLSVRPSIRTSRNRFL